MPVDLRCKKEFAIEKMCIRVDQNLLRVEAPTLFWPPRSMDSIAISVADLDSCEVTMPDRSFTMGKREADLLTAIVNQDDFHGVGCRGPESEVDSAGHRV